MPMMPEHGRSYLQSCLLLLIAERPAHGYELVSRLQPLGFPDADAACTYRALRALEREGLVSSAWRASEAGPARRDYRLTGAGQAELADCGDHLRRAFGNLGRFLARLGALDRPAPELALHRTNGARR